MKRAWDRVTLRVLYWNGPDPVEGDELRTARGRRYLILEYTGKKIVALVLPVTEPVQGRVFNWEWGKRKRRK